MSGITQVETVVVGGGAMGAATAWQLARRGRDVALLERYEPGHRIGASHGASRNFNVAYSDPAYVAMLVDALPLWRELEVESGAGLLELVGVANHGPAADFDDVHAALTHAGIPAEFLPLDEAAARWPGIRWDTRVLFNARAGRVNADATIAALHRAAAAADADVRHRTRATRIEPLGDARVRVASVTDAGVEEVFEARTAVVTLGAWTTKLIGGLALPRLVVTQEQPAHFAVRDEAMQWPSYNHHPGAARDGYGYWRSPVYGMLTPGEGVKAGWHGVGPVVDPDARDFLPVPDQLADLQRFAREWLPGVDADAAQPISCTYTTTPDENFVLGRIGPIVVGAGFSGHGFKFTPVVGRILADLADGSGPGPDRFRADRVIARDAGSPTGLGRG
ncbi:FAD-dependent oxidoreductase [Agromyces marinus]|uniref:N-methyl-L-tryptophan oxidase n=1 Tax=Agromyces marinus TaxID=1389020 RepID=A0ABM8H4S5_9MICO|nr:FAD-dependent oxidoreductase [Agromyces marinus]UIP59192.1 Monomeric sarcosine oxidase [Agromyces marinus]BDZ55809.1 N-methyl-L-tryptophan oxidase [Agromyces marinus]